MPEGTGNISFLYETVYYLGFLELFGALDFSDSSGTSSSVSEGIVTSDFLARVTVTVTSSYLPLMIRCTVSSTEVPWR